MANDNNTAVEPLIAEHVPDNAKWLAPILPECLRLRNLLYKQGVLVHFKWLARPDQLIQPADEASKLVVIDEQDDTLWMDSFLGMGYYGQQILKALDSSAQLYEEHRTK